MGQSFSITATGKDTRSLNNLTAYIPADGDLQKIFLCATTAQVVATASIGVDTPAYGYLKIVKTGENGSALAGVKFGVYSDAGCTKKLCDLTTGSDGTVTSGALPAGSVYVKELSTISPYVIDSTAKPVTISINKTATLSVENITAKGQIIINKTAEQMTAVVESSSDYGTVYSPKFTDEGLAGCVFEVKDAAGKTIATLTTDKNGYAETGLLEFATYTVQEVSSVEGYTKDDTVHSITLAYKDQNSPIVKATVSVKNDRIPASVKVKKMTERWNMDELAFEPCVGEGFVFGLYSAESIGILPKDALVEVLTTDTEGIAASANLPIGYYYLRELQVPDETIYLSQNTFPLSVSGVNTVYFDEPVVNEMFKGNIAVWKSDKADADRMLSGTVFEIRGEDDVLYDTITTDKDGYAISIDLPVGTYHVQEIDPPTGFILSDEVTEITISTDNKNTVVFERSNEANKMTLKKSDIVSSEPVSNATVTIYDASGAVFFEGKTDENGEIHLSEVPAGKYTYGNNTERKYLTADEYLSGNVREKLAWARKSAEQNPDDYLVNVEALEKVQPTDLTASEIDVRLGATWLPQEDIQRFMVELLKPAYYASSKIKVHYSPLTAEWNISGKNSDYGNVTANVTYGTKRINGYKIIEETLNLKDVRIFDTVQDEYGNDKRVLNKIQNQVQ